MPHSKIAALLQQPRGRTEKSHITKWATTWQNQQNECASSEDSDQPGHPSSLIRVFAVSMKKAWVLSFPFKRTAKTLIRQSGCPGWSESLLGAQSLCWFSHVVAQMWISKRWPTKQTVPFTTSEIIPMLDRTKLANKNCSYQTIGYG